MSGRMRARGTMMLRRAGAMGAVWLLGLVFASGPARADERLGVSPCAFLAASPLDRNPVRSGPFKAAFRAESRARLDPVANGKAFNAFTATLTKLLAEGGRAFALKGDDPTDFAVQPAQRFLNRHVLTANASLRVGRDGFEPVPEVAAAMLLSACKAARYDDVIRVAAGLTGSVAAEARAGGALIALFAGAGDLADAAALAKDLTADNFLAAFVLAELAARRQEGEAARVAHARARTLVRTADEHEAISRQAKRISEIP